MWRSNEKRKEKKCERPVPTFTLNTPECDQKNQNQKDGKKETKPLKPLSNRGEKRKNNEAHSFVRKLTFYISPQKSKYDVRSNPCLSESIDMVQTSPSIPISQFSFPSQVSWGKILINNYIFFYTL